jgi:hypothetical protein
LTGAFGPDVHHEFFVTDFAGDILDFADRFLADRNLVANDGTFVDRGGLFWKRDPDLLALAHGAAGLRFSTDGTALNHELLAGNRALPCSSNAL